MLLSDLDFEFPQELIATQPSRPTRVAFVSESELSEAAVQELTMDQLIEQFRPGDVLVLNESKVIPARVFSKNEIEILFLKSNSAHEWQVLFPAREFPIGAAIELPDGLTLTLKQKGLPQVVEVSRELTAEYFEQHGEYALPPYIQQQRTSRHHREEDRDWYQSAWAKTPGSVAAPTASLHFQPGHLAKLEEKGVKIAKLILHVGAGTFLPVRTNELKDHQMHAEWIEIPAATARTVHETRENGGRVWALGTTVTRSLESMTQGLLTKREDGGFSGESRLFIYPPYDFKCVDVLLTNFHQPKSTLLALVGAFAGIERVRQVYAWAIERKFKLFSYGDLSVWMPKTRK